MREATGAAPLPSARIGSAVAQCRAHGLQGRIVAVVDCYDAIVTARPYRGAAPEDDALAEIRACAGTQFDPAVVAAFLRAAARGFPVDPDTPVLPERGE